jgi:predicted kinase
MDTDSRYEVLVHEAAMSILESALYNGFDVIIDETNITENNRRKWIETIDSLELSEKPKVICVWFKEDQKNLEYRMKDDRGTSREVWATVIEGMKAKFEPPRITEYFDEIIEV